MPRAKLRNPLTLVRESRFVQTVPNNKNAAKLIEDILSLGFVTEATVRIASNKKKGSLEFVYVRWLRSGEIPRVGSKIKVMNDAEYKPSEKGWRTFRNEDDLPDPDKKRQADAS
jgi:hypothetical protein